MKNLVIVESPTKARTIGRFLGKEYEIKASMGHIIDLPKSKLGVDVDDSFEPQYELVEDKKKIIAELKSSTKNADSIILATDPDREGEAIASHVADMLSSSSKFPTSSLRRQSYGASATRLRGAGKVQSSKFRRIVFHEITNEAIQEALRNPRSIDVHLVDAQTARRVLDRLVGYKLSPLLWRKVRRGLSAGRVQSVALRLIVEREREIEKFKKEEYWTFHIILNSFQDLKSQKEEMPKLVQHDNRNGTGFELIEINGEKIEVSKTFDLYDGQYKTTKTSIQNEKSAQEIVEDLKTKEYVVSDVIQKEMHRSPQPPYTTSTLQQDAARRLGINGKRTMSLAQKLYEEGYITYHRTDSVAISSSAMFAIINFVKKEYGEKYAPEKPRFYKTRQKLAQEAHEAIRPTRIGELQSQISNLKSQIGDSYVRLYELIWRRAVASQMSDAVIESRTVLVDTASDVISRSEATRYPHGISRFARNDNQENAYRVKATGSVLVFDGFLRVNPQALQDNRLPEFKALEKIELIDVKNEYHETPPPPRYNDASLIKTLEEKGIGRPSTYATIVSTIESRQYIERDPSAGLRLRGSDLRFRDHSDSRNSRSSGRGFIPTAIGVAVNDFLVKNFSEIDDIPFTAQMEDELDDIAHGEKEWVPMMRNFYTPFDKRLHEVEGAERVKIAVEETSEKCPKCKSSLVIRTGRFGKFLACSNFPRCKFTKTFAEKTNLSCPKDRGRIVIKKTRKGRRFYSCSNYPKCDFAAWRLGDIKQGVITS